MEYYSHQSDEVLIQRLRAGDAEIADYLIEKYKDMVRQEARAMYLIGGETDDLIQEGMIGLFKAVRDYDESKSASFRTFAKICVDRQLYNAIQISNRQKHQPLNSYVSLSMEEETPHLSELLARSPEAIIIDRESAQSMEREIKNCLSDFENQVLTHYLRGIGYVQIGQLLNRSPKSIDNALQRIRGKVRDCLERGERSPVVKK